MMDAHGRWATVKNERMGIVLEVTHTDDGGRRARDEQKEGWRGLCEINPSRRVSGSEFHTVQLSYMCVTHMNAHYTAYSFIRAEGTDTHGAGETLRWLFVIGMLSNHIQFDQSV